MRRARRLPLALPAAAVALGAVVSLGAVHRPVPGLVLLAGLGAALGGSPGLFVAGVAGGCVAGAVGAGDRGAGPALDRPATVAFELSSAWRRDGDSWIGRGRSLRFRQAERVGLWREVIVVALRSRDPAPSGSRFRATGLLRRRRAPRNGGAGRPGPIRLTVPHPGLLGSLHGSPWRDRVLRLRAEIGERLARAGGGGALARALALGDTSRLPESWLRGLRRSGLSHLVAVSGLHVGLVAAAVWWLTGWWGRLGRALATAGAISVYALVAGGRPSVQRAAVAGLLAVVAMASGRPPAAGNALAAAVLGLSIVDSRVWLDLGFRMSVGATASLLALSGRLEDRFSALPGGLRRSLAATAAAQLGTVPFAVSAHGYLPLATGPLHLIVLPWLLVVLGLAALYLLAGCVGASGVLALGLERALGWASCPLEGLSRLPAGPWWGVPAGASMGLLSALCAGTGLVAARVRAGPAWLCAFVLLAQGGVAGVPPRLELVVLDVGQGDAILLRDGTEAILVDGGGWSRGDLGGRLLVPALARLGIDRLRALVLTHPDRDHCAGLVEVASYLRVGEVWIGPGWRGDPCAARLLAVAGARPRALWGGVVLAWRRWRVEVLGPPPGARRGRNERSLVLRVEAGGRSALLTGDIGAEAEALLLAGAMRGRLSVDVLKVAHHGSGYSTLREFLRGAAPRLAVVSVGTGNPYGHPSPALWSRLAQAGVPRLRTDRDGQIRVRIEPGRPLVVSLPGPGRRAENP